MNKKALISDNTKQNKSRSTISNNDASKSEKRNLPLIKKDKAIIVNTQIFQKELMKINNNNAESIISNNPNNSFMRSNKKVKMNTNSPTKKLDLKEIVIFNPTSKYSQKHLTLNQNINHSLNKLTEIKLTKPLNETNVKHNQIKNTRLINFSNRLTECEITRNSLTKVDARKFSIMDIEAPIITANCKLLLNI